VRRILVVILSLPSVSLRAEASIPRNRRHQPRPKLEAVVRQRVAGANGAQQRRANVDDYTAGPQGGLLAKRVCNCPISNSSEIKVNGTAIVGAPCKIPRHPRDSTRAARLSHVLSRLSRYTSSG